MGWDRAKNKEGACSNVHSELTSKLVVHLGSSERKRGSMKVRTRADKNVYLKQVHTNQTNKRTNTQDKQDANVQCAYNIDKKHIRFIHTNVTKFKVNCPPKDRVYFFRQHHSPYGYLIKTHERMSTLPIAYPSLCFVSYT